MATYASGCLLSWPSPGLLQLRTWQPSREACSTRSSHCMSVDPAPSHQTFCCDSSHSLQQMTGCVGHRAAQLPGSQAPIWAETKSHVKGFGVDVRRVPAHSVRSRADYSFLRMVVKVRLLRGPAVRSELEASEDPKLTLYRTAISLRASNQSLEDTIFSKPLSQLGETCHDLTRAVNVSWHEISRGP